MEPLDPTTILDRVSRRALVTGAGGLAGAVLLSACGGDEPAPEAPEAEDPASEAGTEEPPTAAEPIAQVSDVPVGGAVTAEAAGKPVIVAQPTQGEIVAMSAICTHMGCQVKPEGGMIRCPCHGSTYDLMGGNTGGPADQPLPTVDVTVDGDDINLA
jgi:cytochrome b6-f complex iron-sulfur subunit